MTRGRRLRRQPTASGDIPWPGGQPPQIPRGQPTISVGNPPNARGLRHRAAGRLGRRQAGSGWWIQLVRAGPEDSRARRSPAGASSCRSGSPAAIRSSRSAAARPRSIVFWSTAVRPGRASSHSGESSQARSDTVVAEHNRRRRVRGGQKPPRQLGAVVVPVTALDMPDLHPTPYGVLVQHPHPQLLVDESERPADVRDVAVPEFGKVVEQQRHGLHRRADQPPDLVVGVVGAHHHARHPEFLQQRDPRVVVVLVEQDEPVDPALPGPSPQYVEILALLAGQPEQEGGVDLVQVLLDADQGAHVERLGRDQRGVAGDDDADGSGAAGRECDGGRVRVEAELLGQVEDPLPGLVADPGAAVQRVRHGCLRDVQTACEIADGDSLTPAHSTARRAVAGAPAVAFGQGSGCRHVCLVPRTGERVAATFPGDWRLRILDSVIP